MNRAVDGKREAPDREQQERCRRTLPCAKCLGSGERDREIHGLCPGLDTQSVREPDRVSAECVGPALDRDRVEAR